VTGADEVDREERRVWDSVSEAPVVGREDFEDEIPRSEVGELLNDGEGVFTGYQVVGELEAGTVTSLATEIERHDGCSPPELTENFGSDENCRVRSDGDPVFSCVI